METEWNNNFKLKQQQQQWQRSKHMPAFIDLSAFQLASIGLANHATHHEYGMNSSRNLTRAEWSTRELRAGIFQYPQASEPAVGGSGGTGSKWRG